MANTIASQDPRARIARGIGFIGVDGIGNVRNCRTEE